MNKYPSKSDLISFMNSYNTLRSKKTAMTKELNALKELRADIEESVGRSGYLHGERVTSYDLQCIDRSIKTCTELRNKLNKQ